MPKFRGTFQQSVEGIESVEVLVDAPDSDSAVEMIEHGDYQRYRVVNHDFARIKQLGSLSVEEV